MISIAKEKYGLHITKTEIEHLTISKKFDIITLFHILEHVPNPNTVIKKCRSLLRNDGILLLAVPNEILSWKTSLKKILNKTGVKRFKNIGKYGLPRLTLDGSLNEIHLSHFTPDLLESFLGQEGFTILEKSLDPYYAAGGIRLVFHKIYYSFHYILMQLTGKNRYDTIWMTVQKTDKS